MKRITLPAPDVERAGEALWRAWVAHVLLDTFPGGRVPPTIADGYAIQHAMVRASGLPAEPRILMNSVSGDVIQRRSDYLMNTDL